MDECYTLVMKRKSRSKALVQVSKWPKLVKEHSFELIFISVVVALFIARFFLFKTTNYDQSLPTETLPEVVSPTQTITPSPTLVVPSPTHLPTRVITKAPSVTPTPSCPLPDSELKVKRDKLQEDSDKLNAELSAEVKELNAMENAGPSNPEWQAKSDAHKARLPGSYALGRELADTKNEYNRQVEEYKNCMAK